MSSVITVIFSIIAALGIIINTFIAVRAIGKVQEVHALVNDRLTRSLVKIGELYQQIGSLKHEMESGEFPPPPEHPHAPMAPAVVEKLGLKEEENW